MTTAPIDPVFLGAIQSISFNSTYNSAAQNTYQQVNETFNKIQFDHYVTLKKDSNTSEIQRVYGTSNSRYNSTGYNDYHEGKAFDTLTAGIANNIEKRSNSLSYTGQTLQICFYYENSFICSSINFTQWNNIDNNVNTLQVYLSSDNIEWTLVSDTVPDASNTTILNINNQMRTKYILFVCTGLGNDIGIDEIVIYGQQILTALSTFNFIDNFSVHNFKSVNNIILNVNTPETFNSGDTLYILYKGSIPDIDSCGYDQYTTYTIIGKNIISQTFISLTIHAINEIADNNTLHLDNVIFIINPNNSNNLFLANVLEFYPLNMQILANGGLSTIVENNILYNEQFMIEQTNFNKFQFVPEGKNFIVGQIIASTNPIKLRRIFTLSEDISIKILVDYDANDEIIKIEFADIYNLPSDIVYNTIVVSQNNSYITLQQPQSNLLNNSGIFIYLQNTVKNINYILHFNLSDSVSISAIFDNLFEIDVKHVFNVNYTLDLRYELLNLTDYTKNQRTVTSMTITEYFAYVSDIYIYIETNAETTFEIFDGSNKLLQSYTFDALTLYPSFTCNTTTANYFKLSSQGQFSLYSIIFNTSQSINNVFVPTPLPQIPNNPVQVYDINKVFDGNNISPFTSTNSPIYDNVEECLIFENSYIDYSFGENVNGFEIVFDFKLNEIQDYYSILCGYNGISFIDECFQLDTLDGKVRCWWGNSIKVQQSSLSISANIYYKCKVIQDNVAFYVHIDGVEIIRISNNSSYPVNAQCKHIWFGANIWKFADSVHYVKYTALNLRSVFINIHSYSQTNIIDYSQYWQKTFGFIDPTTIISQNTEFTIQSVFSENFSNTNTIIDAVSVWQNMIIDGKIQQLIINFQLQEFDPAVYGEAIAGTMINRYQSGILTDDGYTIQIPIEATIVFNSHPSSNYSWSRLNSLQKLVFNTNSQSYELKPVAYFVAMHEIGHALGIGPTWGFNNMVIESNLQTDNRLMYSGYYATLEYVKYMLDAGMNPSRIEGIPLEDDGGPGTAEKHPEENEVYIHDNVQHPALNNELMTGYIGTDASTVKLSKISLGFLHDMGFTVRYNSAHDFSLTQV